MNRAHESAPALDVLAALRAATSERHERLDSGLPLSGPAPDLNDYAQHLILVRDWLAPLQAWLDGFDDGPQAVLPAVERLALIDADLNEPCMPPSCTASSPHVWACDASVAYRWGVAYVVEGSQLGGKMLYGKLVERLAPHPLRYLYGTSGRPGPRWRDFMEALRAHVATPGDIAQACSGACMAFDAILALAALRK